MLRMLFAVLLLGTTACRTSVGADWDGISGSAVKVVFIAGYAQSVHVRAFKIDIDAGKTAAEVAAEHRAVWNASHPVQASACPGDPSIIKFPNNVGELVIIDENLVVHEITNAGVTLPNGMTVRLHRGRCP